MQQRSQGLVFIALLFAAVPVRAADNYAVDKVHSSITFKISHLGLAWIHGRFDDCSGDFTIDPGDPGKCSFTMTIPTKSVDTNNGKRDEHLRSGDFFNITQFPAITFKSTAVKPIKDGYQVTGDFTLHGVTKPVTFDLVGGRQRQFPPGMTRTGFSTELVIKRSEYGMDKMTEMLGDQVHVSVSFEGTKK